MIYKYLSKERAKSFASPIDGALPVYINTSDTHFIIHKEPSLKEIESLIEEYAELRMSECWRELMEAAPTRNRGTEDKIKRINFFSCSNGSPAYINSGVFKRHFGFMSPQKVDNMCRTLSLDEQRIKAEPLKPSTVSEMLAIFENSHEDLNGYLFFKLILDEAESGLQFFGKLIDGLIIDIATQKKRNGKPENHPTRKRVLELLALASSKGWILFPLMHSLSSQRIVDILMNGWHFKHVYGKAYRSEQVSDMLQQISEVEIRKQTESQYARDLMCLFLCSTLRDYNQISRDLLLTAQNLIEARSSKNEKKAGPGGMAKKAYNAILRIRNAQLQAFTPIQPLGAERPTATIDEFISFQNLREQHPHLEKWAEYFEEWMKSTVDTQYGVRRTAANELISFLLQHPNPPETPYAIQRRHINDTTFSGNTFRNFVEKSYVSHVTRNVRLSMAGQFFQFIADKARIDDNTSWMPNPVDMRFDRFAQAVKGQGTPRKTIAASILELMRNILIENDYAWSKTKTPSGHLVDKQTGKLEYVWCPSSALLLYTMLSIPIRGIQARMLDSGEGDPLIFDFELGRMVRNPNQLYVNGSLDMSRREGVLQVMPSGMVGGGDIVGLWITTNKTSDEGYSIPWVSDELLKQLKYQREWLFRYSDIPNMHSINDGQGKRSTPDEFADVGGKFYCLFRDVFADRVHDLSLPVPRQKTAKLWGQLCLEAQTRINAKTKNNEGLVLLVEPGNENDLAPKAIHDLHTLRVSGITDLLDRGVPLNIVCEYVAGHATYIMTLWYDKPAPGSVRKFLQEAHERAGDKASPVPNFSQSELLEQRPFLVANQDYENLYNGFDALEENKGLAIIRHSGICPGTRCSEGALDDRMRASPVPMGDRGPSCPQCRFWLTGPAFLLGQTIEGNQLIFKIRAKTESLAKLRDSIMDAEDAGEYGRAAVVQGQQDIEERQLNDMLTEWWHRMRIYEASRQKLAAYKAFTQGEKTGNSVVDLDLNDKNKEPEWAVTRVTDLELKHFISTCSEFLPEGSLDSQSAKQDIELAVAKFLSINNKSELSAMYFSLDESERLTAANLTIELLLGAAKDPEHATLILKGDEKISFVPKLEESVNYLFGEGLKKVLKGAKNSEENTRTLNHANR